MPRKLVLGGVVLEVWSTGVHSVIQCSTGLITEGVARETVAQDSDEAKKIRQTNPNKNN